MKDIVWIAVDWGTSNLRAWGVDANGGLVAEASSDKGMAKLDRAGFEPALLELIGGWLPRDRQTTVVACGMVGARQGWLEVPYSETPCQPIFPEAIGRPDTRDQRLRVFVLGGIKQITSAPDVMRGEETQIAGILSGDPSFEGVLCLPGTHTKWVRISAGEIVDFKTFMTGELFSLLSRQSVLRHSLDGAAGSDAIEFARSIQLMMTEPASFAGQLFSIRAGNLVSGLEAGTARARLSGLLIGAELAAARSYWFDQSPVIVENGAQSDLYLEGLRTLGRSPRVIDASGVTLAGLKSAHAQIARNFQ